MVTFFIFLYIVLYVVMGWSFYRLYFLLPTGTKTAAEERVLRRSVRIACCIWPLMIPVAVFLGFLVYIFDQGRHLRRQRRLELYGTAEIEAEMRHREHMAAIQRQIKRLECK